MAAQSFWYPDFDCADTNPCIIEIDPDSPGHSQQLRFVRRCANHPTLTDQAIFGQIKAAMRGRPAP